MNAGHAFDRADAGTFRQCADDCDLLVRVEYVCHVYYCTPIIIACQVFLGYQYFMKMLVLAMVLAISANSSPPVPRQTANDKTSQSSKNHRKSNNGDGDSQPSSVNAKDATPQADSKPNPATPSDAGETINVTESPAVPTGKDGWDKASVAFTGLLVIVGTIGICAAYRTLKAVEGQVQAIQTQTAAQMKSDRAWIAVSIPDFPPPGSDPELWGRGGMLSCQIRNHQLRQNPSFYQGSWGERSHF